MPVIKDNGSFKQTVAHKQQKEKYADKAFQITPAILVKYFGYRQVLSLVSFLIPEGTVEFAFINFCSGGYHFYFGFIVHILEIHEQCRSYKKGNKGKQYEDFR